MRHEEKPQIEFAALIGLDWADQEHVLCMQCAANDKVEHHKLNHKPEALIEWVAGLQARFPGQKVAVALEQSRGAVVYALMSYDFIVLYPIHPTTLSKYREAFRPSGASDDPDDAQLILEILRWHRNLLRAWVPDDPATRTISLLNQHRRELVDDQTRLTNRLTSFLKLYYPQALAWAAGELKSEQACDFLERWPTLAAAQSAEETELREFYLSHRCRNRKLIDRRVQEIKSAQPLTQDKAVIAASVAMVQATISQLRAVIRAIPQLEKQIAELFDNHPDQLLFQSFPGAGVALSPRLLAAMGADRSRFANAREVQQFSGIAPVTERSGKSCWVHWRLACPKFVRQSFHEFAAQSIRQSAWAKAFYDQQRQRGKQHHAAVRSLAFRWIRIIYRCWQDRTPYCEATYRQALERRQSPLERILLAGERKTELAASPA